jgi:hypothetical protein
MSASTTCTRTTRSSEEPAGLDEKASIRAPVDLSQTASFAAFTGRARTIFRAGLALKIVGSLVNGLMPCRSFVEAYGRAVRWRYDTKNKEKAQHGATCKPITGEALPTSS